MVPTLHSLQCDGRRRTRADRPDDGVRGNVPLFASSGPTGLISPARRKSLLGERRP